jgi:hypothetical protein
VCNVESSAAILLGTVLAITESGFCVSLIRAR